MKCSLFDSLDDSRAAIRHARFALFLFGATLGAFGADPVAMLSAPGKAVSGSRHLPAEIRGTCFEKGTAEIDFVVTFSTIAEADAFFPLSVYEGPDGKVAPLVVALTKAPKPVTFNFKAGAGWFGVKNDYLLSLRANDTWTFLRQGVEATSVSMTLTHKTQKLTMTFEQPGEALRKFEAACRK